MAEEMTEVTIAFRGKFSIAQTGLSPEAAVKDTQEHFKEFVDSLPCTVDITDISAPDSATYEA